MAFVGGWFDRVVCGVEMGLSQRLDRLDRQIRSVKEARDLVACTCRDGDRRIGTTRYHTVEELEAILNVLCPVHGLRTPGMILWTARWSPLERPDWNFCNWEFGKCPPHSYRDYRMGRRPEPTKEEWQREIAAQCDEGALLLERAAKDPEAARIRFAKESGRVHAVIETFRAKLRAARGQ